MSGLHHADESTNQIALQTAVITGHIHANIQRVDTFDKVADPVQQMNDFLDSAAQHTIT